ANPDDPSRWLTLGRAQYDAARKKGEEKSPQYAADAKVTFTQAIKKWPGEKLFWAYQSELMDFTKDTAGGEALLKDMVSREQFKDNPEPTMMLADHYLRQNKPQDAEAVMKKALETFPANGDVKRRMASYYTQKGEFAKALALL